jgi:hypothetical protein
MIQTSERPAMRRAARERNRRNSPPKYTQANPMGNRATRRHVAKIMRSKKRYAEQPQKSPGFFSRVKTAMKS